MSPAHPDSEDLAAALAVLQPQLVQQLLEVGRETGRFGNQILPQPVSDDFADHRAGRAVDLLVSVDILVGHCVPDSRLFQCDHTKRSHQIKSGGSELFPILSIAWLSGKF
jgi:hypothetical protein